MKRANDLAPTLIVPLLFCLVTPALGTDWSQYRYDSGRTAASPERLADALHLQWFRDLAEPRPAFPGEVRLRYDARDSGRLVIGAQACQRIYRRCCQPRHAAATSGCGPGLSRCAINPMTVMAVGGAAAARGGERPTRVRNRRFDVSRDAPTRAS